jgi:hypothetical protein
MRTFLTLMIISISCTQFASAGCRVVEYPDHFDAICVSDAEQSSSAYKSMQNYTPGQEPPPPVVQPNEAETPDVPPEMIVRNELARLHAASWLKTNPGQ